MRLITRRLVALAAVVMVSPALLACSEEAAPTDASPEDFCKAFRVLADADDGKDLRRFGRELARVGTPSDITDDGRSGFLVVVRVARGLDANATLEELEDPNVSAREAARATDFLEYGSTTCQGLDSDAGGL